MKIVIFGGGSTGLAYGSKLSEVTDTTILVCREAQADAINKTGVTLERPDGPEHFTPLASANVNVLRNTDLVIALTKTYDAKIVADTVKSHTRDSAALVCLHNGLGAMDIYNKALGTERVIGGMTYLGATRLNDTTAKLGVGVRTVIGEQNGEISSRLLELHDLLGQATFKSETSTSVDTLIWDKLILAVGIHAICATTGLSFKKMLKSEQALSLSQQLLNEAQAVAVKVGITFEDSLMERVLETLGFGADHYPSIYQDLQAGRPTEIDFTNGSISQLGREHNVVTPANDTIVNQVHAMESKN